MSENKSDDNSLFRKAFTRWVVKPLASLGFRRYKTNTVARVMDENIFQYIYFQKSVYGNSFTVSVAFNLLYQPNDVLCLKPGERLGHFYGIGEKWWMYEEDDFKEISHKINLYAVPWLDKYETSQKIMENYLAGDVRDIHGAYNGLYEDHMAYVFLKNEEWKKAREASQQRIKIIKDHCDRVGTYTEAEVKQALEDNQFAEIIPLVDLGRWDQLRLILKKNKEMTRRKLNLEKWGL